MAGHNKFNFNLTTMNFTMIIVIAEVLHHLEERQSDPVPTPVSLLQEKMETILVCYLCQ